MVIGTVIGWVGALAVVGSWRGFIGLGVGLLAGGVATVYAFWLVAIGFVLLVLGTLFKSL
jgi:hypothetical protein